MGSGSSKSPKPKSEPVTKPKPDTVSVKAKANAASIPKQVDDSDEILKDKIKHDADEKGIASTETGKSADKENEPEVFLTEVPEPWMDILNEVADCELWPENKRSERPEWRENLAKADELLRAPKIPISLKTKTAVYNGDLVIPDLPEMNKKVLVFVSSTFTDTKAERNNLMKDVYPYVREVCRRLGLEFGTIDMRWGVTDEATKHHSTVKMCLDEIQRCVKESYGPAFLCILGHKYGYRPIPATIDESEYEKILACLINNNHDTSLLKKFYHLDKNSIPPEYVLRSMSDEEDQTKWWQDIELIQEQIREAVVECFANKPEIYDKYFVSVTEMEIQEGTFKNSKRDDQSYFMIRELKDIQNKIHYNRRLRDMKGSEVDLDAYERLQCLIQKKLPENIRVENRKTFIYESANAKGGMHYVSKFCDHVCRTMVEMIFDNFQKKGNVEDNTDVMEIVQHLKLADDKRTLFVGREKELTEINKYLTDKSGNSKPLVISGSSGSGKTALMAVSAQKGKAISKNSVCVVRFIGTTSQSGSVRNLLLSVCRQIAYAYGQNVGLVPDSTRELADYFRKSLSNATKTSPLIIHLDSLDQLSADDNGRKLDWLKLDQDLPKHVKLILSSLEADTLYVLQKHVPEKNFINVIKLLPGEGPDILQKMMKVKGRKVAESQLKVVMDAFLNTPLPLYLSLASDIACKWRSYDNIDAKDISNTIKGMITLLFERLEKMFGAIFVSHALAFITASKDGLSQNELEDVLSCDDEVLDTLFQYWTPPMRRIPPLLWLRVRKELGQYLSERGSDGVTVFTWFHRQFKETAYERYLEKSNMNYNAHMALADYFDGKWTNGKGCVAKSLQSNKDAKPVLKDRGIPKQPLTFGDGAVVNNINRRKIRELPYHLLKINDITRITEVFFNLEFILTKFTAGMGHEFYSELTEAAKISDDKNLIKMVRFIGSNMSFLLREPFAVYQLASQQNKSHPARQQLELLTEPPFTILKNITDSNDSENDACELTLQGHEKSPLSCDFSPKGDRIVSTSIDGCLRIWDVLTGSEIAVNTSLPSPMDMDKKDERYHVMNMRVHTANPCCFSRDGKTIVVGTEDAEIVLFDSDGTKLKSEPTENDAVTCLQFSPNNTSVVAGFKNGNINVFKADTLEHCGTLQLEKEVFGLDFSPDGSMVAVVMRYEVAKIQMDNLTISWIERNKPASMKRNERRAIRPELVLCCCYHPRGRNIMTGSADNHITVWDAENGACVDKLGGHSAWIWSIKITKDGTNMFSSSSDRSIKLWKYNKDKKWQIVSTFYGHSHRVVCSAMDSMETRLVSSSLDCTLKVWNIDVMKQTNSGNVDVDTEPNLHFNTLAISPSTLQIAMSNGWSQTCSIRNIDSSENDGSVETERHYGFIKKAEFTSDGSKLVVIDHGHTGDYLAKSALKAKCSVYYAMDCKKLHELSVSSKDGPTSFSCSRSYIAVGTHLGKVLLFDIGTYDTITSWKWEPNIVQIACSLEGDHVITAAGKECSVWKIKENKHSLVLDLPEHDTDMTIAVFSPSGLTFVTGVESGKIYVWNILDSSVKLHRTLTGHTASVKDICFSKSGRFMVTCGDLSARVWDVENGYDQRGVYYAPINCVVFKTEQEILAGDAVGKLNNICC